MFFNNNKKIMNKKVKDLTVKEYLQLTNTRLEITGVEDPRIIPHDKEA